MAANLREGLLIQSDEVRTVTELFVLSLLIGVPQIATMTAASALVVSELTPEALPWLVFFSGVVVSVIAVLVLVLFTNRRPKQRIVGIYGFLVAGTLAILVYTETGDSRTVTAWLFYLWSRVENVFLAVAFLIAANARLSPRQGRRLLVFTTSGQVLTLVAGGAMIPLVLQFANAEHLIYGSLLAEVASLVYILRFPDDAPDLRPVRPDTGRPRGLTILILALIAAMYLVYFLVDTAFLGGVDLAIGADTDPGTLFARFWFFVGVAALVTKTLVAGRVLHRFGTTLGLVLSPMVLFTVFGYAAVSGSVGATPSAQAVLGTVIVMKGAERLLDGSVFLPSYYGLFKALDQRRQARTQLLAESVMGQGVGSLAGFFLVVGRQTDQFSLVFVYSLGLALTVLWLVLSVWSIRSYRATMAAMLAPPVFRRWPQDIPLVAGGSQTESPERGGTLVESSSGAFDRGQAESQEPAAADSNRGTMTGRGSTRPQILRRLRYAWEISSWSAEHRTDWAPLDDALSYEWTQNIDRIASLVDREVGVERLADRLGRLRNLDEPQFQNSVEGLVPVIPPEYREPLLALLERDEPFLLRRALAPLAGSGMAETGHFPDDASEWTGYVLSLAARPDRNDIWTRDNAFLEQIKRSDLFSRFSYELLKELAESAEPAAYQDGADIVRQGDTGDSLFIITQGSVDIVIDDRTVTSLDTGTCFGELSTILPERRSATVRASGSVNTVVMQRSDVVPFLLRHVEAIRVLQTILSNRIRERLQQKMGPAEGTSGSDVPAPGGPAGSAGLHQAENPAGVPLIPTKLDPEESLRHVVDVPFLQGLDLKRRADLAVNLEFFDLSPGSWLSLDPEPDPAVWVVVSGSVAELSSGTGTGTLESGELTGVLAWASGAAVTQRIESLGGARVARFSNPLYEAFVSQSPEFQLAALTSLVVNSRAMAR